MSYLRPDSVFYRYVPLLTSGGSDNLVVNGSVTPVSFSFAPAANEVWYVEELAFYIEDVGTADSTEFGNIPQLANGMQILQQSVGEQLELANLRNNRTLITMFRYFSDLTVTGLLGDAIAFCGGIRFTQPIKLVGSSDFIRAVVRDNLTGLSSLHAYALVWREGTK